MTPRQCALAAMRGEIPTRLPFIGRMDLWYNFNRARGTLPERYREWSLGDIQRDLNIGIFGFGAWSESLFRLEHRKVEVRRSARGNENVVEYVTPYGTLRSRHVLAEELKDADVTGMQVEYVFKEARDYDALQFLIDHTAVIDNRESYGRFVEEIGEDGLALPFTGYAPMHQLMHHYMGYETFYLERHDHPDRIDRLHESLWEQQRQVLALAADGPAEAVEVGGNFDEFLTPPPVFERYFAPFYREAAATLRSAGKILVVHGDGEMRDLLRCLRDADIPVVEALTPEPMTSINLRATRALWQDRVTLWGGIASIVMTAMYTDEEFEAYLEDLFAALAPGQRFILGFGDNVPTDGLFPRIARVAEWAQKQKIGLPSTGV